MTDSFAYWQRRADRHGPRAVFNLTHSTDGLDAVTSKQWAAIEPHLRAGLSGREKLIVDVGCGAGRMTHRLAGLTDAQVLGTDPTAALVGHALATARQNVRFTHTPDGTLPLHDGAADLALVHLVLGGLSGDTLRQAVTEVTRVLRPGGTLVLVENTDNRADVSHWVFRSVQAYQAMFPTVPLRPVGRYDDAGERITVMRGEKQGAEARPVPCHETLALAVVSHPGTST